jgi:hypothetical protein
MKKERGQNTARPTFAAPLIVVACQTQEPSGFLAQAPGAHGKDPQTY